MRLHSDSWATATGLQRDHRNNRLSFLISLRRSLNVTISDESDITVRSQNWSWEFALFLLKTCLKENQQSALSGTSVLLSCWTTGCSQCSHINEEIPILFVFFLFLAFSDLAKTWPAELFLAPTPHPVNQCSAPLLPVYCYPHCLDLTLAPCDSSTTWGHRVTWSHLLRCCHLQLLVCTWHVSALWHVLTRRRQTKDQAVFLFSVQQCGFWISSNILSAYASVLPYLSLTVTGVGLKSARVILGCSFTPHLDPVNHTGWSTRSLFYL